MATLVAAAVACGGQASPASTAVPAGVTASGSSVDALIAKARQEGHLVATVSSSWSREVLDPLANGFKKRFNLDIDVSVAAVAAGTYIPKAIEETKAGTAPSYDVVISDDETVAQLQSAKGMLQIDGWPSLLAAINPDIASGKLDANDVSPAPMAGYAFVTGGGNVKGITYNPKLIAKEQLPKTHGDLVDPTFKGKFVQSPFTNAWDIAPAVVPNFDQAKWLQLVRAAGANSANVVPDATSTQQVALGQYPFSLSDEAALRQVLSKDKNAPVAIQWWDDFNIETVDLYLVRTGTPHPAAATLFALWMTTPEAEAIWQPKVLSATVYGHHKFGSSAIDQQVAQSTSNVKLVSYFDDDRGAKTLAYYSTPEGVQYLDSLAKAIRGQ